MPKITIFTPTYNRSYTLNRLYNSLVNQTCKDFEWIIVDDGSTDDTKKIVTDWISESEFKIKYFYQENSGKHIAHNFGVENSSAPLFTCLDSDDWFYDNTIEKILSLSKEIKEQKYCGIIGLDTYENNDVIGSSFPEGLLYDTWKNIIFKHKLQGDKAIIFKTEILKRFPFPNNTDKHMPPSYQLFKMGEEHLFLLSNEHLKYVEYLPDGITSNIRKQYEKAPNNYAEYRLLMMELSVGIKFKIKNIILFNVAKIYTFKKMKEFNIKGTNKIMAIILYPLALLYVNFLKKNQRRES